MKELFETIEVLQSILAKLTQQLLALPEASVSQVTMQQKIYNLAKSCLGKDIARTQDELGCAESVSYILIKCGVVNFPVAGFLGTAEFYGWLSKYAKKVEIPQPGDIIISPTGYSTKGAKHGHIGVVANYGVMSNNSLNGLFQQHFVSLDAWKQYFTVKLGFPTEYFRIS